MPLAQVAVAVQDLALGEEPFHFKDHGKSQNRNRLMGQPAAKNRFQWLDSKAPPSVPVALGVRDDEVAVALFHGVAGGPTLHAARGQYPVSWRGAELDPEH